MGKVGLHGNAWDVDPLASSLSVQDGCADEIAQRKTAFFGWASDLEGGGLHQCCRQAVHAYQYRSAIIALVKTLHELATPRTCDHMYASIVNSSPLP